MTRLARRRRHILATPANTTYCAASGSSGNSGLSSLLPKQTYAQAMGVASANWSVLGKGGDLFREQVTMALAGLQFGAWGTGRPTVDGSIIATGFAAAGVGTNTWSVAMASTARIAFLNGVEMTLGASNSTLTDQQFFWSGGIFYVRRDAGNPDLIADVINAGQNDYGVRNNGLAGMKLFNTIVQRTQHTSNAAVYFSGIGAVDNATVTNCIIQQNYKSAIIVHAASTGATFTSNQLLNNGQHGIWFDTTDDQLNVVINSNTITGCGYRVDGAINFPSGIIGGMRSGEISFNVITNQGFGGSGGHAHCIYAGQDLASGLTLLIHDNDCNGAFNGVGIKNTQDATIYNNRCRNNTGGGLNPGQNTGTFSCTTIAHHNVIDGNCSIGGAGIDVKNAGSSGTTSFKGYNNTLYNNSTLVSGGEILIETLMAVLDFRNNILYASNNASSKYIQSFVAQTGTVTIDFNNYFGSPNGTPFRYNGTSMSLATWQAQAFGPDSHSKTVDPLFVTNGSDFHLQAASPMLNVGAVITGITTGFLGAAPDMGAYEKA